jgi:ribosome-binding protein aMBF1 (putative translation factor)
VTVKQRPVIEKRRGVLINVNQSCRHFARHNSTKQTVVHHHNPFLATKKHKKVSHKKAQKAQRNEPRERHKNSEPHLVLFVPFCG